MDNMRMFGFLLARDANPKWGKQDHYPHGESKMVTDEEEGSRQRVESSVFSTVKKTKEGP